MRLAVSMLLAALLFAATAMAGQNPYCKVFVDFADNDCTKDYADVQSSIYPDPGTLVTAYLVLGDVAGQCEPSPVAGITTISLAVDLEPDAMSSFTGYQSLLPGGLTIGDWTTGITLSATECVPGPLVYFASVTMLYSGTPGEVRITDDPQFPRLVVACDDPIPSEDHYCVANYGGVGMEPTDPEPSCFLNTPVEAESWGTIKALYRR
jgi:hypothetical protein